MTRRMTTKTASPQHVVVDGSNIATEGRSMPSLAQLNEAVNSYIADHPGVTVTVVVDATFGHRIAHVGGQGVRRRDRQQRARRSAGRRDRPWRCVRAEHRQEGQGDDPVERLVPGVPRRARLAVRRRPTDRRQARAARRVGLGRPQPGAGTDQPQGRRGPRSPRGPQRGCGRRAPRPIVNRPPGAGRRRRASKEAAAPMPVPTTPPPGRAAARRRSASRRRADAADANRATWSTS